MQVGVAIITCLVKSCVLLDFLFVVVKDWANSNIIITRENIQKVV